MRPAIALALLMLVSLIPATAQAQEAENGKLTMTLAPSTLPADGRTYTTLFVQLLGRDGAPQQSKEPVKVFLASSNPDVAALPQEVAISPGSSYVAAPVTVSSHPGIARFTALALGYASAEVELETVNPMGAEPPYRLVVSAAPPALYPGSTGILSVAIVGSNGIPHLAPSDTPVVLTSSNPGSVELPQRVVIPRLEYMVRAEWTARDAGEASILAQADALEAADVRVQVSESVALGKAVSIAAYPLLPSLPAWGAEQEAIVLQALDAEQRPVPFPCASVFLTSSAPQVVSVASASSSPCDVPSPFITYKARTTTTPGEAKLTAGATGLTSASLVLSTHRLQESRIALKLGPAAPLGLDAAPATLSVQLVDSEDRPVVFHTGHRVALLSSGATLPAEVLIPPGEGFALVPVVLADGFEEGVSVVATAPGIEGASISFLVESRALEVSLDPDTSGLRAGASAELAAEVASEGAPVAHAEVVWEVEGLLPGPVTTQTDEEGMARIRVESTEQAGPVAVRLRASHPGYRAAVSISKVTVLPATDAGDGPSRLPFVIVFAAACIALAAYVIHSSGLHKKLLRLASPSAFRRARPSP